MKGYRLSLFNIIIAILLIFNLNPAFAEPFGDLNSENLAISLVIDSSGSMYSTDPNRLRGHVAEVFIDYLNPEDYLGIITFNSQVDLIIPMGQLSNSSTRDYYKETLNKNIDGDPMANTNYEAALREANNQLENLDQVNVRKIIIFLTDGQPDPDPINISNNSESMDNYMKELWNTVDKIASNNYPIYSIAFSDDIDVDVLNRIASESNGDVRIFQDSNDLDLNLTQILKSRDLIVQELLEPAARTDLLDIAPTLSSDFWLKAEGYRKGEEAVVTAFLQLGGTRISSGNDLIVDKFQLEIDYEDGKKISIPLHDDGDSKHSDIRANDGIWSNKIDFHTNGRASANLIMSATLKGEEITLTKKIGDYTVSDPGNIQIGQYESDLWIRNGQNLSIPIEVNNISSFPETVLVRMDNDFGNLLGGRISLQPGERKNIDLEIEVSPQLDNGIYNISLEFNGLNPYTSIENHILQYKIELVSYLDNLTRSLGNNRLIIYPLLGIFLALPLAIYLLGMLLYLLIGRSKLKVSGTLTYWKQGQEENSRELNLTSKHKKEIRITFDPKKPAEFFIEDSIYRYDLIISKRLLKRSKKFILGWKALLSRKGLTELIIKSSQPGIIEINGEIVTGSNLYNGDKFMSGDFYFKYVSMKAEAKSDSNLGKNILEGRV